MVRLKLVCLYVPLLGCKRQRQRQRPQPSLTLYVNNHHGRRRRRRTGILLKSSSSARESNDDDQDTILLYSTQSASSSVSSRAPALMRPMDWLSIGMSTIYLAHFSSLYTQLPGLYGQTTGLLPIADRMGDFDGKLWVLDSLFSSFPELGLELFAGLGIFVSAAQLVFPKLRKGPWGVVTFGLQWICWHDLVYAGGRFMQYQMDLLLLDAAPLAVLTASGVQPTTAVFGFRWLLSRLYLGAGAVKLLSCDSSWRDLSAVHWHFQSQPLPNMIGAAAYSHVPDSVCMLLTWLVLVVEMAAPFLFLAPNSFIRRVAFTLNICLMVGIAAFGNFGPLQALCIVIGIALLQDEDDIGNMMISSREDDVATTTTTATSLALATGGVYWALSNIGARCLDTLVVDPLVYGLIGLGVLAAFLPAIRQGRTGTSLASCLVLAGSTPALLSTFGLWIPFDNILELFNFGAVPYGLFATMTGKDGFRSVAVMEAALTPDGPWTALPLLYQVNDPSAPLPFCFPHFPRVDWTLWFIPFGETGVWIARFFQGLTVDDPAVVHLVNEREFRQAFPPGQPPAIIRVVPRKYQWDSSMHWRVENDANFGETQALATFSRGDVGSSDPDTTAPWPGLPVLRQVSDVTRPEYFVWGCLGTCEATRRFVAKRHF